MKTLVLLLAGMIGSAGSAETPKTFDATGKPFVPAWKKAASAPEPREPAVKPVKAGELRIEPMFASCGIVFGASETEGLAFEFREVAGGEWRRTAAAPRWFDEFANYRGMAWDLKEDTEYRLRVTAGGKTLAEDGFRTWKSEVPVGKTVCLDERTEFPLVISDCGTSDGWVRYTAKPGTVLRPKAAKSRIKELIRVVNAKYVLIDDLTLEGGDGKLAAQTMIVVEQSDSVRIRNCDISKWGFRGKRYLDAAGRFYRRIASDGTPAEANRGNGIKVGAGARRTVIERCWIHDPHAHSTTWRHSHPAGAFAVVMARPDHSTSMRYNAFTGSDHTRFDDCVGGGGNFSPDGGFNRTAEIYGNFMVFPNDDCIELDGGQQNLACFRNRFEGALCGVSIQGNVVSPSYVFENLFSGMCEELGEAGQTVKTSGFDIYGQGPYSLVMSNVFWGAGSGISVPGGVSRDPNHSSDDAGRRCRIDVVDNEFCGNQKVAAKGLGTIVGNRLGVTKREEELDRTKPYMPISFVLDTCVIDAGRDRTPRKVRVKGGNGERFRVVKSDAHDWFEVSPAGGEARDGLELTVVFRDERMRDSRVFRGAFLVRTEAGYVRPVTVYARTGWTQPEQVAVTPGAGNSKGGAGFTRYLHPADAKPVEGGYRRYDFEIERAGRYFLLVYAQADRRPRAWMAVDDDEPLVFKPQTCWEYPVWSIMYPGRPEWSISPGRIRYYDLQPGKHSMRIKGERDFKPLAFAVTDSPLSFEPKIDFVNRP